MTDTIALRPAIPDDEPWLLDLRRRTIGPYRAPLGLPNDDAALLESVRDHYADAQIICGAGGTRIGLFKVYREPDAWLLSQIQLDAPAQGRGIGAQLIRSLQAQAQTEELPVRLQVLHGNPARRLYERLGFGEIGRNEHVSTLLWQPAPDPGDA